MILTADLSTLVPDETPRRAELWVTSPSVKVAETDRLYAGGFRRIRFDDDGTLAVELLDTDTPGTDPESWLYRLQVRWLGGSLPEVLAELTGDVDLADVQPMDPADPVYLPPSIGQERVVGLQDSLDGKADSSHAHAVADVTGLQGQLTALGTAASTATATGQGAYDTAAYVYQLVLALQARVDALEG